ncbi:HAD family hydrolase [Nonomuraea sp. M3C6]|uniref:HAD family hydrolase n=1 Tax=Nonomuraea marmarensis TaxID=3351344 RepID=A0ABW7AD22_9ACTN
MPSDPGGLDAVLLDMDGTLVDTEGLWWQATAAVAESLGRPLGPADAPHVHGRTIEDVAAHLVGPFAGQPHCGEPLAGRLRLDEPLAGRLHGDEPLGGRLRRGEPCAAAVARQLTDAFAVRIAQDLTIMPGAPELLADLAATAIPTALVSASPRSIVELVVPRLGHTFDLVIANEDTARGKPYPDPYLEAARLLGAAPSRCVAIEDSPTGIAAATAAGCRVLVVSPQNGLPSLDHVRESFPSHEG